MTKQPIGVMGAGWVGLVTAASFADLGHSVVVRDVDPARIEELESGALSIYEPGLDELIRRNRSRLRFTLDAAEVFAATRVVFVCVGTPPTYSGDADLSAVWRLVTELPAGVDDTILVMKSTVPVGTGEAVRAKLDARGLENIVYASNPEFLAEGTALTDFLNPSRIVVGSFAGAGAADVRALYDTLNAPVLETDVPTAEMIKYASNAFLATKISFINEIANVCEDTHADVTVVAEGMGLDPRIGPSFLRAGVGYGGSCFPKDVAALKQVAGNSGYHFQLLNAAIEVNELQKRRLLSKLKWHLGPLRDRTVTLLGVAFKPNTNDIRQAASLVIAARLLAEGARVRAWDPVALQAAGPVLGPEVELCEDLLGSLRGADAAVVVTEWDELGALDLDEARAVMRRPLLIDGRNLFDPDTVRASGFVYEGIGRPSADVDSVSSALAVPERLRFSARAAAQRLRGGEVAGEPNPAGA